MSKHSKFMYINVANGNEISEKKKTKFLVKFDKENEHEKKESD